MKELIEYYLIKEVNSDNGNPYIGVIKRLRESDDTFNTRLIEILEFHFDAAIYDLVYYLEPCYVGGIGTGSCKLDGTDDQYPDIEFEIYNVEVY